MDSYRIGCKDLLELLRDRMMLVSLIMAPLFLMLITGYIFPSQRVLKDIPLGIVNQDSGRLSLLIITPLSQFEVGANKAFQLKVLSNMDEAVSEIKDGQLNGALVIPADFSDRVVSGAQGTVTVITDESNPQISALLSSTLEKVIADIAAHEGQSELSRLFPEWPNPETLVRPFVISTEGIVTGRPNYFQFVVPGVMCMIVIFAAMMGLVASIAREKEDGTIDGILVAPINRLAIIMGKAGSQTVRGLFQAVIVLVVAVSLFNVIIQGNPALVALLLLLGVYSFIGLGVLAASLGKRQETAFTIMATLQFPMLFLSGVFFPINQMPGVLQAISKLVPLTYAVRAMRQVVVLGAGIVDILPEIIFLISFGTVLLVIAVYTFNRAMVR